MYSTIVPHPLSEGIADDRVEVRVPLELAELGAPGAAEEVDAEGGPQGVRHVVLHLGVQVEVPLVGASQDEEAELQRLVPEELGEPPRYFPREFSTAAFRPDRSRRES